MQSSDQTENQIREAAKWFAAHGRDSGRAIIPTVRRQFPRLSPRAAIEAVRLAATLQEDRHHA